MAMEILEEIVISNIKLKLSMLVMAALIRRVRFLTTLPIRRLYHWQPLQQIRRIALRVPLREQPHQPVLLGHQTPALHLSLVTLVLAPTELHTPTPMGWLTRSNAVLITNTTIFLELSTKIRSRTVF